MAEAAGSSSVEDRVRAILKDLSSVATGKPIPATLASDAAGLLKDVASSEITGQHEAKASLVLTSMTKVLLSHKYEDEDSAHVVTDALETVACSLSAARGACEKEYAELYNTLFDASQTLYKSHGIIMADEEKDQAAQKFRDGLEKGDLCDAFVPVISEWVLCTVIDVSSAQGIKLSPHGLPSLYVRWHLRSSQFIVQPGLLSRDPAALLAAEPWRSELAVGSAVDVLDAYGKIQSGHIIAVQPLAEPVTDKADGASDLSELTGPAQSAAGTPAAGDGKEEDTAGAATPQDNPADQLDDLKGGIFRIKWTLDAWGETSDYWSTNVSPRIFAVGAKAGAGKKSFGMAASDKHTLSNTARPCMPDSSACMDFLDPQWAPGGDCVVHRGRGGGGPLHLQVVRAFTNGGYLDTYIKRMAAPSKAQPGSPEHKAALEDLPTPKTVRHVLLSLVHSLHLLNRQYVQHLAPKLLKSFVDVIAVWPDVMLREFNSEVFVTCGNCLRFLFLRVFDTGFSLSQMEAASLSVARTLLHGNLITLRILGMRVIQEACNGVRLNQAQSTTADVLVPIVNEDVLPPLYDPRSAFSDLVRRSADVLRMMARADALTEETLRRLWALKFADAVSSDTKLQVYQVLEAVSVDLSAEQQSFVLCEFLGKLPRSAATVADVQLAYKVGGSSKHQTQVGHIAMQVLWRLLDDGYTGVNPTLAPARELRAAPILEIDGTDDDVPTDKGATTENTPAVDPPSSEVVLTPPRLQKGDPAVDTSEATAEVQDSAGVHLARLTKLFTMKPCKKPYLLLAVAAVQRGANVSRFLQLVWDVVDSYNLTAIAADPETKGTAVAELNAEVNLMDVFFQNLSAFKQSAKKQLGSLASPVPEAEEEKKRQEAVNGAALASEGGITFAAALRTRMDFLTSVTRVSALTVSETQATMLWDMFVTDAMTTSETERVMRFLINAASMSASGLGEVLSKEVELSLFLNKMASADLKLDRITLPVFSAFRLYFLLANARRGWLSRTPGGGHTDFIVHIDPDDMLGTDALWRVALEAPDNDAAEAAMAFLMSLYGQLSPTFDMDNIVSSIDFAGEITLPEGGRPPAADVRSKFIKGCMMHLRSSLGQLKTDSPSAQSSSSLAIASRCLSALSRLMTEADVYGDAGLRPHSARLAGERLKIKFSNSVPAVYCSDDAPKNFNLMLYSNSSVWQVREMVGSKLGLKPQRVKLVRGGSELLPADNAKTLREVKVSNSGNVLVTYKSPAPPKQAPLLMDSSISYQRWPEAKYSPAAEAAFAEMFSRFSFDGFMTPVQFRLYLVACGVGGSNVAISRIQNIFKRVDTTPAGDMTQQGFLDFYKEASVSRPDSVRKDLRQHGYDTRTLQLTDKEKAAAIGQMMRDAREKALAEVSPGANSEASPADGKTGDGKDATPTADEILLQKVADVYNVDLSKDDSRKNSDDAERKRLLEEAEALEAEAQKNNPRLLMTSNLDFFHLLFDALAAPSEVAAPAWELLQRLPTNAEMMERFSKVPETEGPVTWSDLLDSRTAFKLLYALQVVESFLQAPDIGSLENINRAEEVENKATTVVREKAAQEREEAAASGGTILTADQKAAQKVVEDDEDAQRAAKYEKLRAEFAERKAEADTRSAWRAAFVNKAGLQYLHTLLHSFEVPPAPMGSDDSEEDVEATLAREAVASMLCILRLYFLGAVSGKNAIVDAVVPFGTEEADAADAEASADKSGGAQSYAAAAANGAGKTGLTREEAALASQDPNTMSVVNNPDGTFTVIDHAMEAEEGIASSADDAYIMMGLDDERPSKRPSAGGRRVPNALKKRRAAAAAAASSAGDPLGSAIVAQAFMQEFGGDLAPAITAALPAVGTVPRLLTALSDAASRGGSADAHIVRYGLDLLLVLCARETSVLQSLLSASGSEGLMPAGLDLRTLLLSLLLCAESREIRLHTSRGLYRLCLHVTEDVSPLPRSYMQDILLEFLDDVAQASQDNAEAGTKGPLAALLRKDKSGVVPCQQYFALLNNLVRDSTSSAAVAAEGEESKVPAQTPEELEAATKRLRPVMISLVQRVCSHQGLEKRAGSGTAAGAVSHSTVGSKITDTILIGLLSLLTTLAETVPSFRMEMACSGPDGIPVSDEAAAAGSKDFLNCLFVDCLFYEPKTLEDLDETDCAKLPKCKRAATRKAAFKLLSALCEDTPSVVVRLLSVLKPVLEGVTRVNKYRYKADNDARSSTGYLGIFNLTCLCYMISMLQQLFMIPRFRYGVLAADANVRPGKAIQDDEDESDSDDSKSGSDEKDGEDEEDSDPRETTDESMLWQLQRMFGFLTLSLRRFYDPTPWIKAFKMFGQPIDIKVQQDTEEFLNSLLDQLSERLTGGSEGSLVHDIVTGQTTEQFVDTRNGNILKERTEPFHHLSLMVKNVPGVQQSLELLTAGENIDDYHLEDEDVRITINKRTRITRLPAVLFLHCKRFDFSFETFMMEKLNGRFEFEDELDMFPYTREGAEAKGDQADEAGAEEEEEDQDKPKVLPREHYKYRLQGIVIHMGGAQGGHYWSYIRDRATGQWNEFNDSRTSKFDPSEIENKAYGGPQSGGGGNAYSSYDNSANAYMLVYEKVIPSQGISDAVALAAATAGTQYTANETIADPPGYSPLGGELATQPISEEELSLLQGDMPEDEEGQAKFKEAMKHGQARTAYTGAKEFDERLRTLAAAVRGEVEGDEHVSRQTVVEKLLPKDILADVFSDNVRFLRDQDVYSDEFFSFMKDLLARAGATVVNEGDHKAACDLVRIGMDYALNILSKADNNKTFAELGTVMKDVVSHSAPASAMLLDNYLSKPKDFLQGLLSCPTDDVRGSLAGIINCALSKQYEVEMAGKDGHAHLFEDMDMENSCLSDAELERIAGPNGEAVDDDTWTAPWMPLRFRASRCCRFIALLLDNLETAYGNWPRFEQLFIILAHAASLGSGMRRVLVAAGVIETLVDLLMEKESPEQLQAYVRPPDAKRDGIGNPRASPKWGPLLECVSLLVRGTTMPRFVREGAGAHKGIIAKLRASLPAGQGEKVWTSTPPTVLDADTAFAVPVDPITGDSAEMTAEDLKAGKLFHFGFGLGLLQLPKFFESALKGASGGEAVSSMLRHMVWENPDFSGTVCATVASNLNMALEGAVDSYWDVIDGLAGLQDSLQLRRITILLGDPHHMRSHMAGAGFGLPTLPVPLPKKADNTSDEPSELQMERVNRMLAMSGISGGALMATYRRRYSSPKYVECSVARLLQLMSSNPLVLLYVWRLPALTRHRPTEARLRGPAWAHEEEMVVPNSRAKLKEGEEPPRRKVTVLPGAADREEYLVQTLLEQHPPQAFDRFADWMLSWLVHRCEFTVCSRSYNKETLKRLQSAVRTAVAAREAGDALVEAVAAVASGDEAAAAALCSKPADGGVCYGTCIGMPAAPTEVPEDDVSKVQPGTQWRVPLQSAAALARIAGGFKPAARTMGEPKPNRADLEGIFRRQGGRVVSDSHALGVYCCAHEYTAEDGELHLVFRTVSENRQPLDFELTIVSRDEEHSNFPVPATGEKYMYRLWPRDVVFFHECRKVDTSATTWGGFRFNWVYNYVEDAEANRIKEVDSEGDTDTEGRLGLGHGSGRAAPGDDAPSDSGKRRRLQPESDLSVDVGDSDDDSTGADLGQASPSDLTATELYRSDSDYARALQRMVNDDSYDGLDDLGMMADDGNQITFDTDEDVHGPHLP